MPSISTSASIQSVGTCINSCGKVGSVMWRLVSGHYLQDWLLLDTDWNWRLEPELGGSLRAVADIGSHWMDLTSHITGQRIVSVDGRPEAFIPVRQQPVGPVETFSSKYAGATTARTITTEGLARRSCSRFRKRGDRQTCRFRRSAPDEGTRSSSKSMIELGDSLELRASGRSLDSAIAESRTSSCHATPPC